VFRALEAAQVWAARRGATAVGPRELLLGLVDEDEGRAAVVLGRHGLDVVRWRGDPTAAAGAGEAIPLSRAGQQVCRQAQRLARGASEDNACTTDHLLLAVLHGDPDLRRELTADGLDADAAEHELLGDAAGPLAIDEPVDWDDPAEQSDAARILDAAANRAREALRVLEDYVRFTLDDAFLTRELKEVRHALADALAGLPLHLFQAARETQWDVGTSISTQREQVRDSLREVVVANVKRLQEALRTLEEYGKLVATELGTKLEALRYRAYTLERVLLLGADARERLAGARLHVLLSGAACKSSVEWTIAEAAAGGADIVQLREKSLSDRELLHRARDVRRWTRRAGVLFIVNDRPDVARLAQADGVHLGQDDLPVKEARRVLGPDAMIGVSTHTVDQLRQAIRDGASYVGVGPTFPSGTKEFAELAGLEYVRQAAAETTLPMFVLGGVTRENVAEVVAAGGRRVAVSEAIARADDPRAAAAALRRALTG
jgi:thiamine-phosphate pyrophosphorylase